MKLLPFILITVLGLPALSHSEYDTLPYQLEGKNTFLEGLLPKYFCECKDIPVDLPLEEPEQKYFQLIRGTVGISQNPSNKTYALRKWSLFQVIKTDGSKEKRLNERIIEFPDKPIRDDKSTLELRSDEPARGTTTTRTTIVHLDKTNGTGNIQIILWPAANRSDKPKFDHSYPFRFIHLEN